MKKILMLAAVVVLMLGLLGVSQAATCGCGKGMGMGKGMAGMRMEMADHMMMDRMSALGLDEKQVSEVKAIHLNAKKEFIRKGADIEVMQLDLKEMLAKDPVDLKAVDSKVRQIEGLRAELKMLHIKAREEVKAKLNPEQRKKFAAMTGMQPMCGMAGECGMMDECGMAAGPMGMMGKRGMMMRDADDGHDDTPAGNGMHQHH